jgi:mono/diheme cytochrome c family protein
MSLLGPNSDPSNQLRFLIDYKQFIFKTTLRWLYIMKRFSIFLIYLLLGTACEQQPYRMGERLYKTHCANCHQDQGEGLGALIPPLAGADYLNLHRDRLPCIVRHGLGDSIQVNGKIFVEQMPGNSQLNEIQIANVLNYVLQSWGNNTPPFTFEEVQKALEQCNNPGNGDGR